MTREPINTSAATRVPQRFRVSLVAAGVYILVAGGGLAILFKLITETIEG